MSVSALICLSLLPWSILNLREKSGRVILAEFNSFPSHVVNKHTGLEDPSFSTCGHAGRHSSKEILRIGMFRTPFSCGYYQDTENIRTSGQNQNNFKLSAVSARGSWT